MLHERAQGIVGANDSHRTKIFWMQIGRFPLNQNLRNFGKSGNWYSIFPKKFPDFRKLFRNANHSTGNFRHSEAKLNAERKLPGNNFRSLGIHRKNAAPFDTGSCRKFKPDVLIEWNGAHAKVTKFVTNCVPLARARESSANQVSQVKFSFSMVNEVVS